MPFEASKGKKLADFGPNSGAMILLVERKSPICWMDPTHDVPQQVAEIGINAERFGNEIASPHSAGGASFGLRGGGGRFAKFNQLVNLAV
jgi:hypothetical protein